MSGCSFNGSGGFGGGAAAPSGVLVDYNGVPISASRFGTLDFRGEGVSVSDAGGGEARIQIPGGLIDPSIGVEYFDDFIGNEVSSFGVNGGGTNVFSMALGSNRPGTVTSTVSAAGVDAARISVGGNNTNTIFVGGGPITMEIAHHLPTLSDGVNNIVLRDGLGNSPNLDYTNGVYVEYDLATHGNHNYRLCAATGGVRTKVDTGISAVAGSTRRIIITINAAGTLATVTIDGAPGANSVGSNIPNSSVRVCQISLQATKQLGAAARTVIRDYYRFKMIFTTPR